MTSTLYQKQTGSFYTPNSLAQLLAHEVLSAWQQTHPHPLWKNLTILDPACGEGGLLIPFAQELAKLRQIQEPGKSAEVILEDIFQHQLYAADISADALSRYEQQVKKLLKKPVCLHAYGGDSLQEKQGKSVLNSFVPGGADIILANPPYIGQKNHATLFKTLRQNPLWRPYFTAKGDLLYYFFYLALHLLKPRGIGGFITTPYFATSAGGKILRQTLQQNVTFLRLIDFETKQLFKGANLHTLLSVFEKGNFTTPCQVGLPPANITKQDLFYGPASFLQTRFTSSKDLLKRMAKAPFTLGEVATISTGLMTGCDAAFILTEAQKNALTLTSKERAKLKPFFKNSDISPYVPNLHARLWLIDFFYPNDHNLNVKEYPHLLAHLSKFKDKLLARKQNNNGIDKQLALGRFWFGSVRRKLNFETEKIVLPHRAHTVSAAYTHSPWYASSDVYFISNPKYPFTLWSILGLLNAAPYLKWLKANGKRKGDLLELYSAPLKQLPIPNLPLHKQENLEKLTHQIYMQTLTGSPQNISTLQKNLDALVESFF